MGLRRYLARRVIYALATLFAIANFNFLIFQLIPQYFLHIDPAYFFIPNSQGGGQFPPALIKQVEESLGLNQPWDVRYSKYLESMFTGNFGYSFQPGHQSVDSILSIYLPRTLLLIATVLVVSAILGSFVGTYAASHRGKLSDKLLLVTSFFTFSLPEFWVGLILLSIFAIHFHLFPISLSTAFNSANSIQFTGIAYVSRLLWAMVMPWLTLLIGTVGGYLLIVRNTMVNVLSDDYIRMARLRGIPNRIVLLKHALRNSILPVISQLGVQLARVLTGAVIVETVFSFQGLGYTLFSAVENQDFPVVQAVFFIVAAMVIVGNLVVDLVYGYIDPRIRY